MSEIWKDIQGYEGIYQVSNLGRVKSLVYKNERILKPIIDKDDYFRVSLCKKGSKTIKLIHRLVVETFIGDIPKGMVVNHINSNRQNNFVDNLEIVTQFENVIHSINNGNFGCKCTLINKISGEHLHFNHQIDLSLYLGFTKNWCVTNKKRKGNKFEYKEWVIIC